MASQAEIDLIIDATNALPQLLRDLDRITRRAEDDADDIDLHAVLDLRDSIAQLNDDIAQMIDDAEARADDIDIQVRADTDDADRDLNRLDPTLNRLGSLAGSVTGAMAGLGLSVAKAGAAAGTAVPLIAGVATAIESIIPAAALATQGMLAMKLVSATLKVGMMGVEEAIETAFDPEAKPEDLAKAMEKLAPEAKKFVTELSGMKKEFKAIQLDVQNRLFKNLDDSLTTLSRSALPQVGDALGKTADSLNKMGRGAADAAAELAADGTLGKALDGATKGLDNLVKIPAQATTAFGQLAAAAAPAFDRVTAAVARVATEVSGKLDKAFESGALEDAINDAIDVIAQLGRIAGNVFGALRNIMKAAGEQGDGLFGTLEKITQALEDATGTEEFQTAIGELVKTMGLLATTAAPLLVSALKTVAEVITILGPPARELIAVLGEALGEVLEAAREPLKAIATAFGELVVALAPFIALAGDLIAAILPALTPLFETFSQILAELAPVFKQLAENLASQLVPILERLPEVLTVLLPPFVEMAREILPLLLDILVQLQPSLEQLATSFADLLVQLAPVIAEVLELAVTIAEELLPIIGPILIKLVEGFTAVLGFLADIIGGVVVPGVRSLVQLLNGDFTGALVSSGEASDNLKRLVARAFTAMLSEVTGIMDRFVATITQKAAESGTNMVRGVQNGISNVLRAIRGLPGAILSALGGLNNLLFSQGAALINGLIRGITSKIGQVRAELNKLTNLIPDWKGPAEKDAKLLYKSGQLIMGGLIEGFDAKMPDVRMALGDITRAIPESAGFSGSGSMVSPVVYVSIGNEAVDQYVTTRVEQIDNDRTRATAQGVRR